MNIHQYFEPQRGGSRKDSSILLAQYFYTILETLWYDEEILHPHDKPCENDPLRIPNIYHDVTTTTKWLKVFVDTFVIMFTTSSQGFSFSYFVLPLKDS